MVDSVPALTGGVGRQALHSFAPQSRTHSLTVAPQKESPPKRAGLEDQKPHTDGWGWRSGYFFGATLPRPSRTSFPLKCALLTCFAGSAFSPRCGVGPL